MLKASGERDITMSGTTVILVVGTIVTKNIITIIINILMVATVIRIELVIPMTTIII